jgi:hypothetical protein
MNASRRPSPKFRRRKFDGMCNGVSDAKATVPVTVVVTGDYSKLTGN